MGDMEISGFGGSQGGVSYNPLEETMNRHFQLIETALKASDDITQNLLTQIKDAEKDLAKFRKSLDEKKSQEIQPQLAKLQTRLDNLMKLLDSSAISLTPSGSEARRSLGVLKAQLTDAQEQAKRARPAGGVVTPQDNSLL